MDFTGIFDDEVFGLLYPHGPKARCLDQAPFFELLHDTGIVAGCIVNEGKVTRKSKIKVMRGGDMLFEGEIESLKRIKDEVSEVRAGTECGIRIKNFSNIEIGDILDIYETQIIS